MGRPAEMAGDGDAVLRPDWRRLVSADRLRIGAARMEAAAGRRRQRIGKLARPGRGFLSAAVEGKRGRRLKELLGIGVARPGEDRVRGTLLDNLAEIHD